MRRLWRIPSAMVELTLGTMIVVMQLALERRRRRSDAEAA